MNACCNRFGRGRGDCELVATTIAGPSSARRSASLSRDTRPQSAGVFFVARQTQRLEVVEVVRARQLPVLSGARHDVIDFEARDLLRRSPGAHRRKIRGARPMRRAGRTLRAVGAAAPAAIAIPALHRAPRDRPPVIRPEQLAAAIAAPRSTACRERAGTPRARAGSRRRRQRAHREQRILLRHGRLPGGWYSTTRSFANLTHHENGVGES